MLLKEITIMELDTVLDTRLAIYQMLKKDLDELFKEGFRNRVYDRFIGVDFDRYMEIYRDRDKRLLLSATVTELPYIFGKEQSDTYDNKVAVGVDDMELWINVNPYKLTALEKANIGQAIASIIKGSGFTTKVVDIPYDDLTPTFIVENHIRTLYFYQYELWLEKQMKRLMEFEKRPLKLVVRAPWLISKEMDEETANQIQEWVSGNTHPCDVMKATYINYFTLMLEKSRLYTSIIADDIYPSYVLPPKTSS